MSPVPDIDIAGNASLALLRRALRSAGTAVIVGGESKGNLTGRVERQLRALMLSSFVDQRLTGLAAKERAGDLRVVAASLAAGTVTAHIDRTYPLEHAAVAMHHLASVKVRGKIVITT